MTSRDTHDIEAYAKELEEGRTNVQPALLIKLLMESEPCLFSNCLLYTSDAADE